MRRFIARGAVVACSMGLLFAAMPATSQAISSTSITRWKLALDLRNSPNRNPLPSYLGGPAVWSLREGQSSKRNGNYPLLPFYSSTFGSSGIKAWHGTTPSCVRLPAIGVNVTTKSRPLCTGNVPAQAAFVRPDSNHLAVVGWTSPFSGHVTVSHDAIADLDGACGDGVSYYVYRGPKQLQTLTINNNGATTLAPVTVFMKRGWSLYFIVDAGPNGNSGCDTTQLQITVDRA